jgi:cell division protease FtsH
LEKEILFQADLERLIGKRPFEKETTYQAFTNKKDAVAVMEEPKSETAVEAKEEEKPSDENPVVQTEK